jgi:uncharacterized protein YbjT (DUF2867 family)
MADAPLAIDQRAAEASLRAPGIGWTSIRPATYMSNFPRWIDHAEGVIRLPVGEGRVSPLTDAIARLLGREPYSFDQWVREHLTQFRAYRRCRIRPVGRLS